MFARSGASSSSFLLVVGLLARKTFGQVVPTAPGPGSSFQVGQSCSFQWNADTTGTWTSFDVDLMSGSNQAMSTVTRVVAGLDGTKSGSASFTCPDVSPNSAIYFYQFTQDGANPQWTTRFTIASASGATTPPQHSTQPGGAAIPWGIGALGGAAAGSADASSTSTRRGQSTTTSATTTTTTTTPVTTTTTTASPTTTATASPTTSTSSSSSSSSDSSSSSSSASASPTAAAAAGGAFFSTWPLAGRIGLFAGIGVAGLIVLGVLIWVCMRSVRRRRAANDGADEFVNEWDHVERDPYYANQNRTVDDVAASGHHDDVAGYADEKSYGRRSPNDDPYAAAAAGDLRYHDQYATPLRTPTGVNEAYPLVPRGGSGAQHSTVELGAYEPAENYGYATSTGWQQNHDSYGQGPHYGQPSSNQRW